MSGGPLDYLDPGVPLADILLHVSEVAQELRAEAQSQREVAERFDEGIACMEWTISRAAQHPAMCGGLPAAGVLGMLGEVLLCANVGTGQPWIERARAEMGRAG